jgi:hypothetical protein
VLQVSSLRPGRPQPQSAPIYRAATVAASGWVYSGTIHIQEGSHLARI